MQEQIAKCGRIAFITTPKYRDASRESDDKPLEDFIFSHLYKVCVRFNVITTGGTGHEISDIVNRDVKEDERNKIQESMGIGSFTEHDLKRWRDTILESLEVTMEGFRGMIHVTHELVEGRLDAVLHLTDWEDKSAKPDSAVLAREANVHNVPIATDLPTTLAYIRSWNRRLASGEPVFIVRSEPTPLPLDGLSAKDQVLAIIAHDNMKLETCRFAVQYHNQIFEKYGYILATGTTGGWLGRFMQAAGHRTPDLEKIRSCNSGPKGGDIQIAYAVVKGICKKIVFFQDPSVSHPHASDIRLFEQAVLAKNVDVQIATNVESARLLIGA